MKDYDITSGKKQLRVYQSHKPRIVRVENRCLKCQNMFMATGKFNKICDSCTEKNRSVSGGIIKNLSSMKFS